MPWPFRKKDNRPDTTPLAGPQAPRAAGADQALVDEVLRWLSARLPAEAVRQEGHDPLIHLGLAGGEAPAGAVLKIKRGKLAWVDLYDPNLREPINELIRYLDKQQKWSFNGVVSTKYEAT